MTDAERLEHVKKRMAARAGTVAYENQLGNGGRGLAPTVWLEEAAEDEAWLLAEVERLRGVAKKALVRAREDIEGWGAYATPKWDLAGDLAAVDAALAELEGKG